MTAVSLGASPAPGGVRFFLLLFGRNFLSEQCQNAWDSYGTPTLAFLCRRKIQCQNLAQSILATTSETCKENLES